MAKNPNIKRAHATDEFTPDNILELTKCQKDPIYFLENYVYVTHPTKGKVPFKLYDYQKKMITAIHNNQKCIILASRQLGKTICVAMYFLWFTQFNDDKLTIIASKNLKHAVEIMTRVKFAYESLPSWIKCGCKYFTRTLIEFDNGSAIHCEATTENTSRGTSSACTFIDELAFIPKRIQDLLWASISPSLSTGGKFIISSTPNGDNELFSMLWRGAKTGSNSFHPIQAMWYEHPDRDEKYYKEMVGELGELKARQELGCEFLSSDALLINSIRLQQLKYKEPLFKSLGFDFWVPEDQLGGRNKMYMVFMDPATGDGNDNTSIEVFDFPGLNQVAEYKTNDVNIPLIYAKLKWILKKLTTPIAGGRAEVTWSFERNGIGEAVSALYFNDEAQVEEAELFSDSPTKFGIFTSGKTKIVNCLRLKTLIEKAHGGLNINSNSLIGELKDFVAKGGSYASKPGGTDDCVMATVGIMVLLKRLSEYNEDAFTVVNEYVDPDAPMDEVDAPMPFSIF